MANNECRKLPVGIQSFNVIREEGYLYVDKTDMVWKLANQGLKYNYLSRPRRFGKSVLVDTLQAYFEGKKELFEGLKVMKLENPGQNAALSAVAECDENNSMQNLTDLYVENGTVYVVGSYCMGMMDTHAALYEVKDGKLAALFGEY